MRMNSAEKKDLTDLMKKQVGNLIEHVDSVQIIITKQDCGKTTCISEGAGNWYARVQSCREFVEADQAQTHFNEAPKPPPDDGEDWKTNKP